MAAALNDRERDELANLCAEADDKAARRRLLAELLLLRQLAGLVRHTRRRQPAVIEHQLERLPRRPNAIEWDRIAAGTPEALELEP